MTSTNPLPARQLWLQQQFQMLLGAWLGVRKSQGAEAIHEVRVSTRRMRTVLQAWRHEIQPLNYAELRFELRNLGRLLAPAREADVRRRLIGRLLRPVPDELLQAANHFLAHLDQVRAAARAELRACLHSERWKMTVARIQTLIDDDHLLAVPGPTDSNPATLQRWRKDLQKFLRRCAKKRIAGKKLHALRLKGKALRYAGEALSEQHSEDLTPALKTLRQLQDFLGDLHDCAQIKAWCLTASRDSSLMGALELRLEEWQQQRQHRLDEYREGRLRGLLSVHE